MSKFFREYYDGKTDKRRELRTALSQLHASNVSDQRITDIVNHYLNDNQIHGYPKATARPISRPTVQRVRTATDQELAGFSANTMGKLYNCLCHCEELPTGLYDRSIRVQSAHELAPLLQSLETHLGARDGPLDNRKLKSLEGTFHLFREAWTSPESPSYIQCVLRFDWVGDALFYTEEQTFFDPIANLPVDEKDQGIAFPFGMNVVLLGRGKKKDLLKFFSIHDFDNFPDGHLQVHAFTGNFIAVYGKGPHPGFRGYARRVNPDEAETKFFTADELDPDILARLSA